MERRQLLKGAAGAALGGGLAAAAGTSIGQDRGDFPTRPIKLMVGFSAGGATDVPARVLAEEAGRLLRQQVVVENKVGMTGALPAAQLQRTPPDGHTLAVIPFGALRLPYIHKIDWNPATDLAYILRVIGYSYGIVVPASSPFRNFGDYIAYARANPGKLTYASSGVLSTQQLAMEEISRATGVSMLGVAFKGAGDGLTAMLGGHVDSVADANVWVPYVEDGRARLLVVWGERRMARFPDVPTLREVGIGLVRTTPWGIAAPRGTPAPVVRTLHDAFREAMASARFRQLAASMNLELQYMNAGDYQRFVSEVMAQEKALLESLGHRLAS